VQGALDIEKTFCANKDQDFRAQVHLLEVAGNSMSRLGWNCSKT